MRPDRRVDNCLPTTDDTDHDLQIITAHLRVKAQTFLYDNSILDLSPQIKALNPLKYSHLFF